MPDRLLPARITRAGLASALKASNSGLKVNLTQVAIGRGVAAPGGTTGYTPTAGETALVSEFGRYLVGGTEYIAPNEAVVSAYCDGAAEGWINEVGFFCDDGTLFALWSEPNAPLAFKTANVGVAVAFTLGFTELPANLVQFIVGAPNISISVVGPFSNIVRAVAQLQRENINTVGIQQMSVINAAANAV